MKYSEWIEDVISSGLLCKAYTKKVLSAMGKKDVMDIVLDSNGISYIPAMRSSGHELPYSTIMNEFRNYINGRYVRDLDGYTSSIYCMWKEPLDISTTLTCLLACECEINVAENDFVRIYLDRNCRVTIHVPKSSRAIVEVWNGCDCDIRGNVRMVEIKKH